MGCNSSGCRRGGVYEPTEPLRPAAHNRRGSKPTLLRGPPGQKDDDKKKLEDEEKIDSIFPSESSTSTPGNRRPLKPASRPGRGVVPPIKVLSPPKNGLKVLSPVAVALTGSTLPLPPSASLPPPSSSSEGSERAPPTGSEISVPAPAEAPKNSSILCCGNICGAVQLLRARQDGPAHKANGSSIQPQLAQLPIARSIPEDRSSERHLRAADLRQRFRLAREAAKAVSLSAEDKLQLYAYEKQATEGPVSGPRPGAFNMLARARWDSWAKLKRMDKEVAKQGYCALVDKFAPGWRTKAGL
ncbi:2-trans-enoyl-CoA isomerase) (pECI) [Durusdinium trenchii]|uniref:2-trans-enoyl-CoA isomerase (PECI n=1 Tax=Durusdinium trenchii TaxID=1381693 RepID=A0ABP0JC43_9DINO